MTVLGNEKLSIDLKTCTGCGLCVLACPVDVIRMDAVSAKAVIAYPRDCQVCYLCEDDCPTDASVLATTSATLAASAHMTSSVWTSEEVRRGYQKSGGGIT